MSLALDVARYYCAALKQEAVFHLNVRKDDFRIPDDGNERGDHFLAPLASDDWSGLLEATWGEDPARWSLYLVDALLPGENGGYFFPFLTEIVPPEDSGKSVADILGSLAHAWRRGGVGEVGMGRPAVNPRLLSRASCLSVLAEDDFFDRLRAVERERGFGPLTVFEHRDRIARICNLFSGVSSESYEGALDALRTRVLEAYGRPEAEIDGILGARGFLLAVDNDKVARSDRYNRGLIQIYNQILEGGEEERDGSLFFRWLAGAGTGEGSVLEMGPKEILEAAGRQMGAFDARYPLTRSQRECLYAYNSPLEIVPVSGPPGNGKTSLLRAIVAEYLIDAAGRVVRQAERGVGWADLEFPMPPVAFSTNNQALKNIVEGIEAGFADAARRGEEEPNAFERHGIADARTWMRRWWADEDAPHRGAVPFVKSVSDEKSGFVSLEEAASAYFGVDDELLGKFADCAERTVGGVGGKEPFDRAVSAFWRVASASARMRRAILEKMANAEEGIRLFEESRHRFMDLSRARERRPEEGRGAGRAELEYRLESLRAELEYRLESLRADGELWRGALREHRERMRAIDEREAEETAGVAAAANARIDEERRRAEREIAEYHRSRSEVAARHELEAAEAAERAEKAERRASRLEERLRGFWFLRRHLSSKAYRKRIAERLEEAERRRGEEKRARVALNAVRTEMRTMEERRRRELEEAIGGIRKQERSRKLEIADSAERERAAETKRHAAALRSRGYAGDPEDLERTLESIADFEIEGVDAEGALEEATRISERLDSEARTPLFFASLHLLEIAGALKSAARAKKEAVLCPACREPIPDTPASFSANRAQHRCADGGNVVVLYPKDPADGSRRIEISREKLAAVCRFERVEVDGREMGIASRWEGEDGTVFYQIGPTERSAAPDGLLYEAFAAAIGRHPLAVTTAAGFAGAFRAREGRRLPKGLFDLLLVDEAGMVLPTHMAPLHAGKRAVFFGDTKQIEPVYPFGGSRAMESVVLRSAVQSGEARERIAEGWSLFRENAMSLSNRAVEVRNPTMRRAEENAPFWLLEHFRCPETIIGFCNGLVYRGVIRPMKKNEGIHWLFLRHRFNHGGNNLSPQEAATCAAVAAELVRAGMEPGKIGVVTPYRNQASRIRAELERAGIAGVTVGTVHAFQGSEREAILFSTVTGRGMAQGAGSLFMNRDAGNMLNVAVSRAKRLFVLVGNEEALTGEASHSEKLVRHIRSAVDHAAIFDVSNPLHPLENLPDGLFRGLLQRG